VTYYPTPEALPEDLRRDLPPEALELFRTSFNAAYAAEKSDFEQAGKIAWGAVQTHFERRPDGGWARRATRPPRM
jgi:cation transport regulator ChaB